MTLAKLVLCLAWLAPGCLLAQQAKVTEIMSKDLADLPGKEGLMITVTYPPGCSDPVHRHNAHGFISSLILLRHVCGDCCLVARFGHIDHLSTLGGWPPLLFYFAFCSPILSNMNQSRCVVTFTDSDRIVHEVEVWASTVYEAVGEAMREFRAGGITKDLPGLNTELSIAVHRQPVTHKLQLKQVTQWASRGGKGPQDLLERKRIQHLLGTDNKA